jgi:mRNA-degrading endonuclease toxin of MazEF toxin-antitoxin module
VSSPSDKPTPPPDVSPGEVYWVDIPKQHTVGSEQYENRPYVIVSRVEINRRGTVVGVPFTSVKDLSKMSKLPPYHISVPGTQLKIDWGAVVDNSGVSVAKADQVRVLDRARLGTRIGSVSGTALLSIKLGVQFVLDI